MREEGVSAREILTAVVIVESLVGRNVTDQVHLHSALAEVVELNLEPVHLKRAGVRGTVTAAIDS